MAWETDSTAWWRAVNLAIAASHGQWFAEKRSQLIGLRCFFTSWCGPGVLVFRGYRSTWRLRRTTASLLEVAHQSLNWWVVESWLLLLVVAWNYFGFSTYDACGVAACVSLGRWDSLGRWNLRLSNVCLSHSQWAWSWSNNLTLCCQIINLDCVLGIRGHRSATFAQLLLLANKFLNEVRDSRCAWLVTASSLVSSG